MKNWIKKKKIRTLRDKLLRAKEDQMHHKLVAQHYNDVIHDIEAKLDELDAYHSDSNLINYDFSQHKLPEPRIITAGQL